MAASPQTHGLDEVRAFPLVTPQMVAGLSRVDTRLYKAGHLGANRAGFWRPPRESKQRRRNLL
jgi:hypothetical protein